MIFQEGKRIILANCLLDLWEDVHVEELQKKGGGMFLCPYEVIEKLIQTIIQFNLWQFRARVSQQLTEEVVDIEEDALVWGGSSFWLYHLPCGCFIWNILDYIIALLI